MICGKEEEKNNNVQEIRGDVDIKGMGATHKTITGQFGDKNYFTIDLTANAR